MLTHKDRTQILELLQQQSDIITLMKSELDSLKRSIVSLEKKKKNPQTHK